MANRHLTKRVKYFERAPEPEEETAAIAPLPSTRQEQPPPVLAREPPAPQAQSGGQRETTSPRRPAIEASTPLERPERLPRRSWGDEVERELPPVPSGIVMADYDAVYSSEDDEGEYDGEYVVWNDEAAYEDDGAEDDVGAHRPSCSRTATSRVVAPLSEGGLKIDNVEFDVLCRRATTRTNIPWPQGDVETVQEGDIFDGLRATVRTAPKQLTPLLPSTLREAKLYSQCDIYVEMPVWTSLYWEDL